MLTGFQAGGWAATTYLAFNLIDDLLLHQKWGWSEYLPSLPLKDWDRGFLQLSPPPRGGGGRAWGGSWREKGEAGKKIWT